MKIKNQMLVAAFFSLVFIFSACASKSPAASQNEEAPVEVRNDPPVFYSENIEGNYFSFTVNDVTYQYYIDFPLNGQEFSPELIENTPLVIMVHGANMTGESFKLNTLFDQPANERGYTVVYVTAAPYNKVGIVWNSGISSEGNDDVLFFRTLVQYLENEFKLDSKRTFAVGFSNGGFMMHRLAMEAGDVFEACVSVGAKMPAKIWNERNEKNNIGYFQITGTKDEVIPKHFDNSARFSKDPAIEDVMDYWAESNGLANQTQEEIEGGSILYKWKGDDPAKKVQVWHLAVKDGRHSWTFVPFNKVDTNSLILDFLDIWK